MSVRITDALVEPVPHPTVGSVVAASELLLFRRDLGGTLTDILVAAAGRALAAHPVLETGGVGIAVPWREGVLVPVIANAADAPLPQIRAEVARVVGAARSGMVAPADAGDPAVTVCDRDAGGCARMPGRETRRSLLLGFALTDESSPHPSLALSLDAGAFGGAEAAPFLRTLACLLERPYRRLF